MTIDFTTDEVETLLVQLMVRRNELADLWQSPNTCIDEERKALTLLIYKIENALYDR